MDIRPYDDTYSSNSCDTLSAAMCALIEMFVPPGARCLDVSCTEAKTTASWLQEHGYGCINIDMSDRSTLEFEDESFDAAIMIGTLERLMAPVEAASEVHRILKPGGVLLVTAPNVSYWRRRLNQALMRRGHRSVSFNPSSLRHVLLQAGFGLVGVEGHDGAIARDLPLARHLWKGRASALYRVAERLCPTLLGYRVGAFALKA
jgi:SAM-dependent methyltransferase